MLRLAQELDADQLISESGFALLVGMVLDQQIPLERAFAAPLELQRRLGGGDLDVARVAAMDPAELAAAFSIRPALHRFPVAMADRVGELARIVVEHYGGHAESIWSTAADGRELLARIRELPGFGEQKARIFVALLGKQLGARPTGWREAAGAFGEEGSRLSIADIEDADSLAAVRAHKAAMKAAAEVTKAKTAKTTKTAASRRV